MKAHHTSPSTNKHLIAGRIPHSHEFIRDVEEAASAAPSGSLLWADINRLAAARLRPSSNHALTNASQLGHALLIEMVEQGSLRAELTTTARGEQMVARVISFGPGSSVNTRGLAA